jgi:ketosteroid isomerase-like protein
MPSNDEVVNEHIRAVVAHDWDAAVDGYADGAVVLAGPSPIVGKDAIRAMFASIPQDALPSDVSIDHIVSHGEYSYVKYEHHGMQGGDSFHIRDGKIVMQSAHLVKV